MPTRQITSRHVLSSGGESKAELLSQLREAGVQMNPMALQLFSVDTFETGTEQRELVVEVVSVKDLGLSEGGTFEQITAIAEQRGLALCPLELGPRLRLAFMNQQQGSIGNVSTQNCAPPGSVTVASKPISTEDEVPKGFYLRVIEGTPWLRGYRSWSGHVWSPQDVLAFVVRASAA
jgi:hypothetical protein